MANKVLTRSIFTITRSIFTTKQTLSRSYISRAPFSSISSFSFFCRRPLVALAATLGHRSPTAATLRGFATWQIRSSLNKSLSHNRSNSPRLDGCDLEHYLVEMEKLEGNPTGDEFIDSCVKVLAQVIGSEDEARMKIYFVYPYHDPAFGALVSEELAYKIKDLPTVRSVRPDAAYGDHRNKKPRGRDLEPWFVLTDQYKPKGEPTRDEIIDRYIKILAQAVGSKDEARKKIYKVSTKHYFGFGALLSEELCDKLRELPEVHCVYPDHYKDVTNKPYSGEPFINGQAVPYDPKYHEAYLKILARGREAKKKPCKACISRMTTKTL